MRDVKDDRQLAISRNQNADLGVSTASIDSPKAMTMLITMKLVRQCWRMSRMVERVWRQCIEPNRKGQVPDFAFRGRFACSAGLQ